MVTNWTRYTPPQALWITMGRPGPPSPIRGQGCCAICGGDALRRWLPFSAVCKPSSFSGHDALARPDSPLACAACAAVMAGRPPDTLRMWSLAWTACPSAALHRCNRGGMDPVLALLTDPPIGPWWVSVATSGQIHTAIYARWNRGAGPWTVRFEREYACSTPSAFAATVHHAAALIVAGYTAREILARGPSPGKLYRCGGPALWTTHTNALPAPGGGILERLALHCLRKETADEWHRRTGRSNPN